MLMWMMRRWTGGWLDNDMRLATLAQTPRHENEPQPLAAFEHVLQSETNRGYETFTSFCKLRRLAGLGWPGNNDGQDATDTSPT
jgi:hypothetical protein